MKAGPAFVLAAVAALPAGARAALGPLYGGEATVTVPSLPSALAPAAPADATERLVLGLVHETLVRWDPEAGTQPGLAREWTEAADGREQTLVLAGDLVLHDGRPLAAGDAARSVRRFLRGGTPAARRLAATLEGGEAYAAGHTDDLPGVKAASDLHLSLRLRARTAHPLAPLASPAAAVTGPQGAGAGPFVPAGPASGSLRLTAFSGHVRGRPLLDTLRLVAVADAGTRDGWLRAGRAHLVPGRPGPESLCATLVLAVDPAQAPFDRAAARAALSAALPRAELVAHFVPGGQPARGLLPPALLDPVAGPPPAPGPVPRTAVALTVAADVPARLSQRVVAYLDAMGLRPAVRVREPREARQAGGLRLLLLAPEVAEGELALRAALDLAPTAAAADTLRAAAAQPDEAERRRLLRQAEAQIEAGHALLPLAWVPVGYRGDGRLRDARVDAGGRLVLEQAWLRP